MFGNNRSRLRQDWWWCAIVEVGLEDMGDELAVEVELAPERRRDWLSAAPRSYSTVWRRLALGAPGPAKPFPAIVLVGSVALEIAAIQSASHFCESS